MTSSPMAWRKVTQKGAVPKPREGHSCSVVGKFLFLFAGTGEGDVCFQDFHVFDVAAETWSPIKFTGTVPSKRNNHSACVIGSKIFIFGGFLDGVAGNDVHFFDASMFFCLLSFLFPFSLLVVVCCDRRDVCLDQRQGAGEAPCG